MDKSRVFIVYNVLGKMIRAGKITSNQRRLNQALALVQSDATWSYVATPEACSCPDHQNRLVACKHMMATAMRQMIKDMP